jgi:hypothetical protein
MKRVRLLGVALMAVFMFSAVAATVSSAAEPTKVLPEPTVANPLTSTDKSGLGTLRTIGGKTVICEKDTSTASFTSPNLGTFHVHFEGCSTPVLGAKVPCTGTEDSKGSILLLGTVHYWLALLSEKLVGALVFLYEQFHFTCEALGVKQLVLVRGCAAALAEPLEKLTKITKDVFAEEKKESGKPDIRFVLPEESSKELECITETNVNETKFEESAAAGTAENEKFEQGKAAVEVLLMNK